MHIGSWIVFFCLVTPLALASQYFPAHHWPWPAGPYGALVRQGFHIVQDTHRYAGPYARAHVSCTNCHLAGGARAYAAPLDVYGLFPSYQKRWRTVETLNERVQDCFLFSENGKAPPLDGHVVTAVLAYIQWISHGQRIGIRPEGVGFVDPGPKPQGADRMLGRSIYRTVCASCHGARGQGTRGKPPLWGPKSYNAGAGLAKPKMLAAFVLHNMPANMPGILIPKGAWAVAEYVDSEPRPPAPLVHRTFP